MVTIKKHNGTEAISEHITLYVILHGEIVMIDDKDPDQPILVMAPEVPGHAYQAGPWLGEVEIDRGAFLRLEGVVPGGKASIFSHPDRCVLFENVPGPTIAPYFAALFPRPEEILPGFIMKLQPGLIKNVAPNTVTVVGPNGTSVPTGMDLHTIFKYTAKDPKKLPALHDAISGTPMFFASEGRQTYLSLHVYAAEQFVMAPPQHVGAAIQATSALLGITAEVDPNAQGGTESPIVIQGLDLAEYTVPLGIRTNILGQVGSRHRTGRSADLSEAFRVGWEPARSRPHIDWTSEGTCGSTGGCPAVGLSIEEYVRKLYPKLETNL